MTIHTHTQSLPNAISLGLRFRRLNVQCLSTAGVPYVRGVSIGMPAIPDLMLKSVVYLYPSKAAAQAGSPFGGTGFLVGVKSKDGGPTHIYLVTNYHCICPTDGRGNEAVRVNTLDGGTDVLTFDPSEFHWLTGRGDVAIKKIALEPGTHQYLCCSVDSLLTEDQANLISVGEDVFMIGRFIDLDGNTRNMPAARFGHVSVKPTTHEDMPNSAAAVYYCLDMHSRSGFSGSPVWAYRTYGSNLEDALTGETEELGAPKAGILGIHCSQFPEKLKASDGTSVSGWSGMCAALPSSFILELLNSPQFVAERAASEMAYTGRRAAVMESAKQEATHDPDEVLRRMLNSPAKPRKSSQPR